MSIHFQDEKQFEKWRKKARALRAQIEDPDNAPVVVELMDELDKLQKRYQKLDKRVKALEAQVQRAYIATYNRDECIEQVT